MNQKDRLRELYHENRRLRREVAVYRTFHLQTLEAWLEFIANHPVKMGWRNLQYGAQPGGRKHEVSIHMDAMQFKQMGWFYEQYRQHHDIEKAIVESVVNSGIFDHAVEAINKKHEAEKLKPLDRLYFWACELLMR
jgi:hypothetical protein